jgi:hypothetical protein
VESDPPPFVAACQILSGYDEVDITRQKQEPSNGTLGRESRAWAGSGTLGLPFREQAAVRPECRFSSFGEARRA